MTVYFPINQTAECFEDSACFQSCHLALKTIAELTGLTLALFSPEKNQVFPAENINSFCQLVYSKDSSSPLFKECIHCHREMFDTAAQTGEISVCKCFSSLRSFVLPVKSPEGKLLFYIAGGHFITRDTVPPLEELARHLSEPVEAIQELYHNSPILDDKKFQVIVRRLSEISLIYIQELLQQEEEKRAERVTAFISEIARRMTGEIKLRDLLLSIVQKVSETFRVGKTAIALLDKSRQFIEIFASNTEYADEIFGGKIVPGRGATGLVVSSGEVFFSYDAQNDPRLTPNSIKEWNIKSLLSFPLKLGNQVIGLMHMVAQDEKRVFSQQEIRFAEALVSEIALVAEIGRLYNESLKRAGEITRSRDEIKSYFTKIGSALSTSLDLKELLKLIVELSVRLTHSDAGSIFLIDNKKLSQFVAVTFENGRAKEDIIRFLDKTWVAYATGDPITEKLGNNEIRSYLGIPLERSGEIKGLLNIIDYEPREFTPEEVELLSIFAGHASLAIDNARMFVLEQEKAREATAMYEAVKAIGECMGLQDVLDKAVEQLAQVIGVDRSMILLLDYKKLELYMASSTGLSEEQRDLFSMYRIPIDEINDDLWESLIQGKPARLASAPEEYPAFERFFAVMPTNSCLLAPLLSKEQLIGVIYVDDSRLAHTFNDSEVRLVMTLSIQIASAIQRAILVDQLENNLDQLKALHQVSTAVTGTLSLSKVFDLVVEKASQLIEAPAASMLSYNDEKQEFILQAHYGLTHELENEAFQQVISDKAAKRRRYITYYVTSDFEGEDPSIYHTLKSANMGGYISVPLIARKRVVGVLNCFCKEGDKFDSQEIRLLSSFANQASTAVENARLYAIIQNKVRELATVFEVGKSITSTLELEKVVDEITSSVVKVMNADAASIMMLDEKHQALSIIHTYGLGKTHQGDTFQVGSGIAGIAAKVGRPMVLQDTEDTPSPYKFPNKVRADGLKTILSVPLKVRDKVIGLINLYKKIVYNFNGTEINLVTTLANQAAVAIENARLYKEQYKIAQIIRRNLMPQRDMTFRNLDVGHVYIPSETLSGDYYEIIDLGNNRYGIVISDVSGKGTEAAIYNARAKYILRSYALADYSPSDILSLLNNLMEEETEADKFITLIYVDLDTEANEMIVASAGHEPLIFWDDSEKEAILFEDSTLPIGVFADTPYHQKLVDVGAGDILVLYTDGVTEGRSREGELFGSARLVDIIKENFHLSAQALANKILTTAQKFTRRQFSDDFSLLVVKLPGKK